MKRQIFIAVLFLMGHPLWAEEAFRLVLQFGPEGKAEQKIEAETGISGLSFYVAGPEAGGTLEGKVFQSGGGLLVPVKEAELRCDRLLGDTQTVLWRITLALPKQEKPVAYVLELKEIKDGKAFTRGLVQLFLVDPVSAAKKRRNIDEKEF